MSTLDYTGPDASAYGPLVSAIDVELALLNIARTWIADYLADVERQHELNVGYLPYPRSWVVSSEVEKMPEDQTPAILIASPGLTDPPRADGRGSYTARWRVNVGVHMSARGNSVALVLVRLYVLALRAMFSQQQRVDELALRRIDWMDERYDTLASIDDRTVCTATVELAVEIADVTNRSMGPLEPILGPGDLGPDSPTWPTATVADVVIDKVALDAPMREE